jgi:hypothetical protein
VTEPEVDEARFQQAQRARKISALQASPSDGDCCGNCLYFLEPDGELSFCWHEKLQILVGANWWCHYWEMADQ